MDIMLDLWFDFNKIHSGVTDFSIGFVFFQKYHECFGRFWNISVNIYDFCDVKEMHQLMVSDGQ